MKKRHVQLTDTERNDLEKLISNGELPARVVKRALALLALDRGETLESVAAHQQISNETVAALRNRYRREGLACLYDQPRPGRPAHIDESLRAKITALAHSAAPEGHTHWALRMLAEKIVELGYCEHISHTQVANILKKG